MPDRFFSKKQKEKKHIHDLVRPFPIGLLAHIPGTHPQAPNRNGGGCNNALTGFSRMSHGTVAPSQRSGHRGFESRRRLGPLRPLHWVLVRAAFGLLGLGPGAEGFCVDMSGTVGSLQCSLPKDMRLQEAYGIVSHVFELEPARTNLSVL